MSGETLIHDLAKVEKNAEPLLSRIVEIFPDFTEHDIKHSRRILKELKKIIPSSLKNRLNVYEIYFLIASSYLHDIGMVNFPELIAGSQFANIQLLRDHIREDHNLRSERFIIKHFKDLGLEDVFQARIIGRICRGHRRENLQDRELFRPDKIYKEHAINIPLLAAFLRIGDELDLTFKRTPVVVYEHVPPKDTINKNEWQKHLAVSGVARHPDDPLMIKCSADCKNPKIHRALRGLETKINKELEDLPKHLYQYRQFRKDLPRDFFMEIEAEGYKAYDFKFSLQEKQIVDLLMGEKLYKRKEDCLRELLQNSIDSCRRRSSLEKGYQPRISFEFSPDREKISILDNGMGMDEYTIKNYFTKIGRCFYTSPEFLAEGAAFTPTSQFGVGIISCFMLARKIIVETKAVDSLPLRMEIDNLSDYFFVAGGKRKETGTTVALILKEKLGKDFDLANEISRYAFHTIPVNVSTPDGESVIKDKGYDLDLKLLWGNNLRDSPFFNKFTLVHISINEEDVKGTLGLLFEKDKQSGVRPPSELGHHVFLPQYRYLSPGRALFVSNEGIFVNNIIDLIPNWFALGLIGDINLSGFRLDLNLPRNDIIRNKKFESLRRFLENKIVDKIDEIFQPIQPQSVLRERDNLFAKFFNSFLRTEGHVDNKYVVLDLPEKLVEMIQKFYFLKCLVANRSLAYRTWNDLLKEGKSITILRWGFPRNIKYVSEFITNCSSTNWDRTYIFHNNSAQVVDFIVKWKEKHGLEIKPFVEKRDFHGTVQYATSRSIRDLKIFPISWKVVKYTNYQSKKIIEGRYPTLANLEHKFIFLLVKYKNIINTSGRKQVVLNFFRRLNHCVSYGKFKEIEENQRVILQWFRDAGKIKNIDNYILTEKDFRPRK